MPRRPPFRSNACGDFNRGDYVSPHDAPPVSYRGRGPKNYQRGDERIFEDACERLAMDHDVDPSDIEVSVQDGIVTLNGTVRERWQKRRAEDIVDSVAGVKDVQNNVRVAH